MDATTATVVASPRPAVPFGRAPRTWTLAHCPESPGAARRITRTFLDGRGIDDDTADGVLLVVSELVTNAVEHALPPVVLRLEFRADGNTLHIEVGDGGPSTEEGSWADLSRAA